MCVPYSYHYMSNNLAHGNVPGKGPVCVFMCPDAS